MTGQEIIGNESKRKAREGQERKGTEAKGKRDERNVRKGARQRERERKLKRMNVLQRTAEPERVMCATGCGRITWPTKNELEIRCSHYVLSWAKSARKE